MNYLKLFLNAHKEAPLKWVGALGLGIWGKEKSNHSSGDSDAQL